jgi:uridine kinase/ribulose-5-phosphate 4-epimerase/fuculose-1-phosphate aldolase
MAFICISGSSGVGKTTISTLMQSVLGAENCTTLSGDDLHRWERTSPVWKIKTHLDPEENDLERGYADIRALMDGKTIERRKYNHDTGIWDSPILVQPREHVLYEGLHALYHIPTYSLADLTIFVDTDDTLKTEWKVKRDTKKRGYTESQVLETMKRRKKDEELYITPQKERADVVVKFTKGRDGSISLEYISVNGKGIALMDRMKEFYDSLRDYMNLCKWISLDPSLVQGPGGNVSVKSKSGIIIKSSGARMSDVNLHHGFSLCDIDGDFPEFQSEEEYTEFVHRSRKMGSRPSMETGFHVVLPERVVVHTHPIHLNAILCSKEARGTIRDIFHDLSYDFIEYTRPGMMLTNRLIEDMPANIIFLENHGLIVCSESPQEALETTERINNRCKRWLANHVESFVDLEDCKQESLPLFPDAAVLPDEMRSTNNYILGLLNAACLSPNYLSEEEATALNSMISEKYRKAIA